MSADVWVGALTTLGGGLLGGAISVVIGRQQARENRLQRQEEDVRERLRRSATREFQNAARAELGVSGPAEPWDSRDQPSTEGQVPA